MDREEFASYKFARIFETPQGQILMKKEFIDDPMFGYQIVLWFRLMNGLQASASFNFGLSEDSEANRDNGFDEADLLKVMEQVDPIRKSLEVQFSAGEA